MLRILFVLSMLVPGVVLAAVSRYWGLLLYLWNAFFRPQDFIWMRTRNFRLSLVLGLLFVVPTLLSGTFPNVTHPLSIGSLLFLATGLIAQINAIDQVTGWRWIDQHARLTVVLLLALNLIRTPRQLMGVIAMAACSLGFYTTKAGLGSLLGGGVQFGEGLDGTFSDNNGYALATVMILPLLVVLAQNTKLTFGAFVPESMHRWVTLGLYISVLLSIYTIISTFSRGGFIGLASIALAYVMFHPRRGRMLSALALIVALAFVVPLPRGYLDRIATISELQEDVSSPEDDVTHGRLYMWALATEMVIDHPQGVGMRNFAAQFNFYDETRFYGRQRDVHSSHFQVLVEQGFAGAAIWIFQFLYAFIVALRVRKRSRMPGLSPEMRTFLESTATAFIISMVGFVVGGSAISLALNELTWLTFILLASLDYMSLRLCAEAATAKPAAAEQVEYRMPASAVARSVTPPWRGGAGVGVRPRRRST